jgi:predicted Zn finger-like uncharacterized protein
MVISCPECSTKFRVSAEKIPARGARLRCARCRHIFFVKPEEEPAAGPAAETPPPGADSAEPAPTPSGPDGAAPQSDFPAENSAAATDFTVAESSDESDDPFGDTDFGFDETPAASEETAAPEEFGFAAASAAPNNSSGNIDFGFEDEEEAAAAPQADRFAADGSDTDRAPEIGAGVDDEFDASAFADDGPANDDAFTFDEDYGNVEIGGEDDDQAFSFAEETAAGDRAFAEEPAEPRDEISTQEAAAGFTEKPPYPENDQEELPPADLHAPTGDDDAVGPVRPEGSPVRKKRGPLATLILFLLVLILGILAAGGILYWQSGPEALQQIYQRLTGEEVGTAEQGSILVRNLQGSFISNKVAGELLVIQGEAVNNFRDSRAALQVKGILFDDQGNQLRQKTIFCGNPISAEELRSLPYDKLEEIMGNQFGESLVNLNVTPGQVIPFTIVFRDIPAALSEFTVEVAGSNPAAQ